MPNPCAHQTQRKTELRRVIAQVQGAEGALAPAVEAAADMTARTAEIAAAATDRTAPGDAAATAATATETAAGTFFASTTSVAIADMATDASSPMTQEADDIKPCAHKNVSKNILQYRTTSLETHSSAITWILFSTT